MTHKQSACTWRAGSCCRACHESLSGLAGHVEELTWPAAGPTITALINAYSKNGSVGYTPDGSQVPTAVGAAHRVLCAAWAGGLVAVRH